MKQVNTGSCCSKLLGLIESEDLGIWGNGYIAQMNKEMISCPRTKGKNRTEATIIYFGSKITLSTLKGSKKKLPSPLLKKDMLMDITMKKYVAGEIKTAVKNSCL